MHITELSLLTKYQVKQLTDEIYLSDDESDVLNLVLRGKSVQEIAMALRMSERTVYRRRDNITKKLSNLNEFCKNKS